MNLSERFRSLTVVGCFCHLSLTMFPFKHTDPVCKGVRTRDFSSERSSWSAWCRCWSFLLASSTYPYKCFCGKQTPIVYYSWWPPAKETDTIPVSCMQVLGTRFVDCNDFGGKTHNVHNCFGICKLFSSNPFRAKDLRLQQRNWKVPWLLQRERSQQSQYLRLQKQHRHPSQRRQHRLSLWLQQLQRRHPLPK